MPNALYNALVLVGLGLVAAGAWLSWGMGFAMMVTGALVLVLTILAVR